MGATRKEVYAAINSERDYQDEVWAGHDHEVGAYLTLLREYTRKADSAWVGNSGDAAALEVIRKIAAIAVACMEQHGAPHRPL